MTETPEADAFPAQALTPRAARTLTKAAAIARSFGTEHVGTEHILLATLDEGQSVALAAIQKYVERDTLREEVIRLIKPPSVEGFETHPTPWGSAVVFGADRQPRTKSDGLVVQYFVDSSGQPVRDASGHLVHCVDVRNPRFGLHPVELVAGDTDRFGNRLHPE